VTAAAPEPTAPGLLDHGLIEGLGTPEAAWAAWPALAELPRVAPTDLVASGSRLVVLAPHPDDETLGAGGLLAALAAAGRRVAVVAVTDGTGSHPGSTTWTPARLAATRPAEQVGALGALGVDPPVARLGLTDTAVRAGAVAAALAPLLGPGDTLLSTWRSDGHPDHEACGQAAARLAAERGLALLEVPVWTWHWASPGDPRVPWRRAVRVDTDAHLQQRKLSAIGCFPSQTEHDDALALGSVLPAEVLARLTRHFEVVLR